MNTDLFPSEPARDRKARILIVEDNAVIRDLLRGIMRHEANFIVVGETTNGENAIDLAEKLRPDLICLDVLLPGLDGIAILRAVRAVHPEMRVVIVTGQATNSVVSEALALGFRFRGEAVQRGTTALDRAERARSTGSQGAARDSTGGRCGRSVMLMARDESFDYRMR